LQKIAYFWKKLKAILTQFKLKIQYGLFVLSTKVFGRDRVLSWLRRYENTTSAVRTKYHESIDTQSPYYKPIVSVWRIVVNLLLAAVVYIFCVQTNFLWLCGSMPSIEDLQNPKVAQAAEIYAIDGQLIGKIFTENRTPIDYDSLSPYLVDALVATEDVRFRQHSGIDSRAMLGVVAGIVQGNEERGGGSTITQQLAKKLFNTRKRSARGFLGAVPGIKTLIYKTKEWITAIKLESNFSKEEILTMYFNTVDYGNNTYGIKTAARYYFNKTPRQLNVQEAAMLVGLQKATTTYNPIKNYEKSLTRRNTVIGKMVKDNKLSQQKADSIVKLPIALNITPERVNDENNEYAAFQYFNNNIKDYIEKWGEENGLNPYTEGLRIHTSLDSRMQRHAMAAVEERMRGLQQSFENHWAGQNPWRDEKGVEIPDFLVDVAKRTDHYKALNKKFNKLDSTTRQDSIWYYMNQKSAMTIYDWKTGREKQVIMSAMDSLNYYKRILRCGMLAMDPYTGQIKAWVGGLNFKFFKYDAVGKGKRQPGSTFKPFVYCAAIDSSAFNMTPCDRIKDQPFEKKTEEKIHGRDTIKIWRPKNSTGGFSYQELTLRRALARSVNSVTAHLTEKIGAQSVVNYAKKLGIRSPLQAVPSIGLGPFDVSLIDMVAAYSTFPNSGRHTDPVFVTRITDAQGSVLEEFVPKSTQVITEESAFLMIHMLKGGIEEPGGTSQNMWTFGSLFKQGFEMGGKTGTTSNNSDGWFMGITKDLVVGAWVGGDDRSVHFRSTNLGEGAKTALPLVGRFLEKVYNDPKLGYTRGPFPKPTIKILKEYKACAPTSPVERRRGDSTNVFNDSLYYAPTTDPVLENADDAPLDTTNSE
jgi:penicillin-binding protein 1A